MFSFIDSKSVLISIAFELVVALKCVAFGEHSLGIVKDLKLSSK
jgi:hypothetical protein